MDAFDAMLEACFQVVHTSTRCRACGGHGFRELDLEELGRRDAQLRAESNWYEREHLRRDLARESICSACRGTGYVRPAKADRRTAVDSMWTTVRCSYCRGSGGDAEGESCSHCRGHGYRQTLTARPKGTKDAVLREALDLELVLDRPLPATLPEEVPTMPPYLRLSVIARACRLSQFQTRTLLNHLGLLEMLGSYGHVRTERLRTELPEVYERVVKTEGFARTREKSQAV